MRIKRQTKTSVSSVNDARFFRFTVDVATEEAEEATIFSAFLAHLEQVVELYDNPQDEEKDPDQVELPLPDEDNDISKED